MPYASHHTILRNVGLFLSLSLMIKIAISKECASGILSAQKNTVALILIALYLIAALNVVDLYTATDGEEEHSTTWTERVRFGSAAVLVIAVASLGFSNAERLLQKKAACSPPVAQPIISASVSGPVPPSA